MKLYEFRDCGASDRKNETTMLESGMRNNVMLNALAIPCLLLDENAKLLDCNDQTVSVFGFTDKQEFLEMFHLLSPEYQNDGRLSYEKAIEMVRETLKKGSNTFRWDHIKNDGSPLPMEISLKKVEWNDGFRVAGCARDLSRLVETEDNFRRLHSTVERSPIFNLFIGTNGEMKYVNSIVSSTTGYSKEEIMDRGLPLIFSFADYGRLNAKYFTAALKDQTVNFEMSVNSRNRKKNDFLFTAFCVEMSDGQKNIGLLGKNITEMKQMQRDLAAAREQAEKTMENFIQHNKSNNKTGGESPDNSGSESFIPVKQYTLRGKIGETAGQMRDNANDIPDMAGQYNIPPDFNCCPFSFSKAIAAVIDSVKTVVESRKQAFIADIDAGIYDTLNGDEHRFRQAPMKLLSNAVKFTPKNGTINFSARELENDGNECVVRFVITDNGIGMRPEMVDRLNRVFEQTENSAGKTGAGTGLSFVKYVADKMKGRIQVESEAGVGAEFIIDMRFGIVRMNSGIETACTDNMKSA